MTREQKVESESNNQIILLVKATFHQLARIAQLVERVTSNHEVSGSSPLVSILFLSFSSVFINVYYYWI